ncbi:CAMK/CAMK-unique protein kinase [Mycena venus]|uniref:CAMK/CAMK-unique protein kinase n=1 Tax=Mycena venus TaxID=2733690 RepID=A0A8H6YNE9_9AGAR|nr:CAMK/CAMK-unique protein kinase [Mycena venus]
MYQASRDSSSSRGYFPTDAGGSPHGPPLVIDHLEDAGHTLASSSSTADSNLASSPAALFLSAFSPDAIAPPETGSEGQLVGEFTLGPIIAHGSSSIVRRATSASTDAVVAVKVVPRQREHAAAQRIVHEEAVCCAPVGSLFDIMRGGVPAREDAWLMFRQVVRGLRYLHVEKRLVHCDVKLENVLIDETGVCRIANFEMAWGMDEGGQWSKLDEQPEPEREGVPISSASESGGGRVNVQRVSEAQAHVHTREHPITTTTKFPPGSLPYAAPELLGPPPVSSSLSMSGKNKLGTFAGKSASVVVSAPSKTPAPAQDIWALGVLLYALLVGTLPFMDSFEPRLGLKILAGAYTLPTDVSGSTLVILQGCLAPRAQERWDIERLDVNTSMMHPDSNESTGVLHSNSQLAQTDIPAQHRDLASATSSTSDPAISQEVDATAPSDEPPLATFVIYTPETLPRSLNDPTAIRPGDVQSLEEHVPEGGNNVSMHVPTQAENWVEQHYDTILLKKIRAAGLAGPLATMLSPDTPALSLFGSILNDRVLELAKALCDVSAFTVMVRPAEDDPLLKFLEAHEIDIAAIDLGYSSDGSCDSLATPPDSDMDSDSGPECSAHGAFRPRGGASRADGSHNLVDPDYIMLAGIDRPDGSHRTRVKLHLQLNENCLYDVAISSKTAFKFQTEKGDTTDVLTGPITRPQVLSCVDLKVEARSLEVLTDRSYSNLGFIVHRPSSIAGRQYLPRGFDRPSATATRGTQKSLESGGELLVGVEGMQPAVTAKLSHKRTAGETLQLVDNKPAPSCHIQERIGKEWDADGKSYSSYDVAWHPMRETSGNPHPVDIRFGMGIEFYGKEERYITKLPKISHVLRNQVILWVFDPELKAKVRGMIVLTSTYIPDIKIVEPLTIVEDEAVNLAPNRCHDPPIPDNAPLPHDAANSVAIALFDKRTDAVTSGLRKMMQRLAPNASSRKTKAKKPLLIDLPLYEYVSRGWDTTSGHWRNTVWPTLDAGFLDAGLSSSSAAWNLALHPAPIPDAGCVPGGR